MAEQIYNRIVMMNFSGVYKQEHFYEDREITWVEVQGLSGCNCYCDDEAFRQLQEEIREFPAEGMHLIDSGNYHYMSRIWLEKIQEPFRLLVFDNHTDMQPPAFGGILSCGGWIAAALEELPLLQEVILVGPDEEAFGQVDAEWRKRVHFLSRETLREQTKEENSRFFRETPMDLPLYLSIDKDVLCTEDADTAWSQGDMHLSELLEYLGVLGCVLEEKSGRLLGMDVCGECDPARAERSRVNDRANRALLEWFLRRTSGSKTMIEQNRSSRI